MTDSYQQNNNNNANNNNNKNQRIGSTKKKKNNNKNNNQSMKPNVVVYTSVLNACRPWEPSEKIEAFDIALLTLKEMIFIGYDSPNHVTYAAFLSVCAFAYPLSTMTSMSTTRPSVVGEHSSSSSSLLSSSRTRDDAVRWAFHQCRDDGQVGNNVLENLRKSASVELYEELMMDVVRNRRGDGDDSAYVGIMDIPASWKRNVKGERRPTLRGRRKGKEEMKVDKDALIVLNAMKERKGTSGVFTKENHGGPS